MFDGKSILITGGTGSFGQAFIKHLLTRHKPCRIAAYSRDELKQHDMRQECNDLKIPYCNGDFAGGGTARTYQLREHQASYNAAFGLKNGTIEPENTFEWR